MTRTLPTRPLAIVVAGVLVACSSGSTRPASPVATTPISTAGPAPTTSRATVPPPVTEPDSTDGVPTATDAANLSANLSAGDPHPLDGLSALELARVRQVLTDAGLTTDTTRYPYIGLRPPPKADVLAWRVGDPFSRQADVVLHDLASGAVTVAAVDLVAMRVVSAEPAPDLEPGYVADEFSNAIVAAQADERMTTGLATRGIDPAAVYCLAFSPGAPRAADEQGRRLLRVSCFRADDTGAVGWSQPIDGLVATVALDGRPTVLSVFDAATSPTTAAQQASPTAPQPASPAPPPANRPAMVPVDVAASSNAKLTTSSAEWAGWNLRWRIDRRVGMVLSDVSIDAGWGRVPVLYEASIADMYVPYQDPDPAWSWRTFLDAGEFGLGATLSELAPGVDCPASAAFAPAAIPNDRGDAYTVARAVCVYERATGAPLWRHSTGSGAPAEGAAATELVLRSAMTVGNYDYLLDVVFGRDGSIRFEVAAAGIVLQRSTSASTEEELIAAGGDAHGTLVAPGLVGVHHDHFLNFRLDLDVGGPVNRFVTRRLGATPVTGDAGRSEVWATTDEPLTAEGSLPMPASPGGEIWRVESMAPGSAPSRPAFTIAPGDALADPIVPATETALASRAAWASRPVWVTAYDPAQRFAGGASLPGGTADGLASWVAAGRSVDGADLVAWFTMGFHHIVRSEDLPSMPVHRAAFALVPENVFPLNPAA